MINCKDGFLWQYLGEKTRPFYILSQPGMEFSIRAKNFKGYLD